MTFICNKNITPMASQATVSSPSPDAPVQRMQPVSAQLEATPILSKPPQEVWQKYRTLPQSTAAAQRDLLIMQARCKVAGQNMDAEFERVRNLLDHYFHLLRDLQETV